MKKEYIVTEISMSPDGSPYVFISMLESRDLGGQQSPSPQLRTGVTVIGPTPPTADSIAKELQKALSGLGGRMGPQATVVKLDVREYQDSGLKVGDKVSVEITRLTKEEI